MNKETIAREINHIAPKAIRTIRVHSVDYTEGQVFTTKKAESWDIGSMQDFQSEDAGRGFELVYICKNLPVHAVDYDNEEEVEILDAVEAECEGLVPAGTTFEVLAVSTDDDFEEMGYYEVELKFISNDIE